jgi:hypothetical protein
VNHTPYKCGSRCTYENHCMFCDGGLFCCTACNGFEGTLTTDCPGRFITEAEGDAIYRTGTLDFVGDRWVSKNPITPPTKEVV